jgi:hypothetical protein
MNNRNLPTYSVFINYHQIDLVAVYNTIIIIDSINQFLNINFLITLLFYLYLVV